MIAGYATSALFTTVAFLEALANELFADARQGNMGHLSLLDPDLLKLIAELGASESVQKSSVIAKFDLLLRAAKKEPISKSCNPAQDLATAIKLRNELVHYKAEWFDVGTPSTVRSGNFLDSTLPEKIKGRFSSRPGLPETRADRWLGAGCASWALKHAITYTDEVFARLEIKPFYDHVRQCLPASIK